MAQGNGYWYNPENNVAVEINRHEHDIKIPKVQKALDLHWAAEEELETLPVNRENEDRIKIIAVESGQIRARDWQNFFTIQLSARKRKLQDALGAIADLIQAFKDKGEAYNKLTPHTKQFARDIANSWTLKIDNLATNSSQSISPDDYLKQYADEGFLEEANWDGTNRPVKDIAFNSPLVEEVRGRLKKRGYYKDMEMKSLFEDRQFTVERKRQCLLAEAEEVINETQRSQSRAWEHMIDPAVFGIITAYRGEYQDEPDKHGRRNKQRQAELIDRMKTLGYGVFKLHGAWDEGGGVGTEESLLWYPRSDKFDSMEEAGKDLLRLTQDWSEEFEQDGAIYRDVPDPESPVMLWRHKETDWDSGKVTMINDSIRAGKGYRLSDNVEANEGKLYINKLKKDLGDAWSQLKKGPKDRNFVFESEEEIEDESEE